VRDPEGIALLRQALLGSGYTIDGLLRAFQEQHEITPEEREIPALRRMLAPDDAVSVPAKLFFLGVSVPADEAERAFAPLSLERLAAMGVLRRRGEEVEPLVEISPMADLLVASDTHERRPSEPDHVITISLSTLVLASITVRVPVDTALDVGCGSGFQTLLAAKHHAKNVVATDINPRALSYARFNAALNEQPNVELREGSLFDPVHGETFEMIVTNPPYAISPESEYAFRDSGLPGHSFVEGLVRELPAYLREGGYAHLMAEWVIPPGSDWSAPLLPWVERSGCDAVLLHYRTRDPLRHAAGWNESLRGDPEAYGATIDRWVDYLKDSGIEQIGWGVIVLRRRSGRNWVWAHQYTNPQRDPAGHHMLRLFLAQDFVRARDDDALLEEKLIPAGDHAVDLGVQFRAGKRVVQRATIRLQGGFAFRVDIDELTLALLRFLDGRRSLREAIRALADEQGELEAEQLEPTAVAAVRRLLELGLLGSAR
jgi:SAM-dependent methyltransferase